jgi:phosphate starvation-inducible PhoH-like protein
MAPWTRPIFDIIGEYYRQSDIARMLDDRNIEISPLAYQRGRTFKNSWIIFDEAQNSSINQMKMMLTRPGENTKMVITGDLNQIDKQFRGDNGLQDITEKIGNKSQSIFGYVHFNQRDTQRSKAVREVLKLYGEE